MRKVRSMLAFSIGIFLGGSLAYCSDTQAADYAVATLRSYHFDRTKGYNENNLGAGYEHDGEKWSAALGFYENSFRRTTVYGFVGYTPLRVFGWKAGVMGGFASAYDIPLLGGILVMRDWGRVGVNVALEPSAIALQAKWRFSE